MNPYQECSEPNFWLSCMTIAPEVMKKGTVTPETVRQALEKENIESRPVWKPMHLQPVYVDRDFVTADGCDTGTDIFTRGLCLPSDIKMTEEEQDRVTGIIRQCFL